MTDDSTKFFVRVPDALNVPERLKRLRQPGEAMGGVLGRAVDALEQQGQQQPAQEPAYFAPDSNFDAGAIVGRLETLETAVASIQAALLSVSQKTDKLTDILTDKQTGVASQKTDAPAGKESGAAVSQKTDKLTDILTDKQTGVASQKTDAPASNESGAAVSQQQTDDRRALILELAKEGKSPRDIADILNQRGIAGANNRKAIAEVIRRGKPRET